MASSWSRIAALTRKDVEEVRRQPGVLIPAVAMVAAVASPGFLLLIVAPRFTGVALADPDLVAAAESLSAQLPALNNLTPEGRAQAFLLQQFLMFSLLVPIFAALSLAAQAFVGEKQSKSLEPLLTTPITVPELLLGKVLTPLLLALLLMAATYLLHLVVMLTLGEAGVWRTLFLPRTLMLYLLIGPLVSVTALLSAAIVSSRANDARSAQQLGGLIVLPLTGLFVAQLAGQFLVNTTALALTAAALLIVNLGLVWLGVRVFQRETILLRWK
ncbi:MAG TPA: ABC transporter permease subunit [Vicinamibacterales bacterium]|nr:ABC transporter permease subunit [Vicinamibacterales bacterium]